MAGGAIGAEESRIEFHRSPSFLAKKPPGSPLLKGDDPFVSLARIRAYRVRLRREARRDSGP